MNAGERIGGRYDLESPLGEGATGSVWVARDVRLGTRVAIKFLTAEGADFRARFGREATALARLRHPRIASATDFDSEHDPPYLVMTLAEGVPLDRSPGPRPPDEVRRILLDVASGLAAAHADDVVHRDVKPGNIVVDPEGRSTLVDFGLVTSATATTLTSASLGTPEFWSPEQARGERLTGKSDVYALGVVAFELLTGASPFPTAEGADRIAAAMRRTVEPAPPVEMRSGAPSDPGLAQLVADMLRADPGERPTAQAVATRLQMREDDARSNPLPPEPGPAGPSRGVPLAIAAAAAVAIVVLVIAVVLVVRSTGDPPPAATAAPSATSAEAAEPTTTAEDPAPAETAIAEPEPRGIRGRFGSFDTIQQCRGLGDAVECFSSASGMLVRLSAAGGVSAVRVVDARPWQGATRALPLGVGVPLYADSEIFCLSSRRGITCGFDPGLPFLGEGTEDGNTGTLTGCGPDIRDEYFAIGDRYVRVCRGGVEERIDG